MHVLASIFARKQTWRVLHEVPLRINLCKSADIETALRADGVEAGGADGGEYGFVVGVAFDCGDTVGEIDGH